MFLDKDTFSTVIQNIPLISIDLIVKNRDEKILLGKRINEPAKAYWFVPGGRIYKDETLERAFCRIVKDEIGLEFQRNQSNFHGIYEHFYTNNVFNDKFSTHYIVLAHNIKIESEIELNKQHEAYRWFSIEELLEHKDVHEYTKNYFKEV